MLARPCYLQAAYLQVARRACRIIYMGMRSLTVPSTDGRGSKSERRRVPFPGAELLRALSGCVCRCPPARPVFVCCCCLCCCCPPPRPVCWIVRGLRSLWAWMERLRRHARACSSCATGVVSFPLCYLFIRYSLLTLTVGKQTYYRLTEVPAAPRPTGPKRVCRVDKDTSSFGPALQGLFNMAALCKVGRKHGLHKQPRRVQHRQHGSHCTLKNLVKTLVRKKFN